MDFIDALMPSVLGKRRHDYFYCLTKRVARQLIQAHKQKLQLSLVYLKIASSCQPKTGSNGKTGFLDWQSIERIISEKARLCLPSGLPIAIQNFGYGECCLYIAADSHLTMEHLQNYIVVLTEKIEEMMETDTVVADRDIRITSGFGLIDLGQGSLEQAVYWALREARDRAGVQSDIHNQVLQRQLGRLIREQDFTSVFQPVVTIPEGDIFGYEALTRPDEGSGFAGPAQLFAFAAEKGMLYPLERVTREMALQQLSYLGRNEKLFLNINPQTINDPGFTAGVTQKFVDKHNLTPENIVFEITEGTAIDDYPTFCRVMDHYRNQGFLIAIDDFGNGCSSLKAIAELQPDFIKLDMSLVRGVQAKPVLQALIETFLAFARKAHVQVVAEGIESREELVSLAQLGIMLGQGYYLARPGFPPPQPVAEVRQVLGELKKELYKHKLGQHTVNAIASQGVEVDIADMTKKVVQLFEHNPQLQGIGVTQQLQVVGLIMREKLYAKLGTRYGYSLYMDRPVTTVMDANPLIIDAGTPLEVASQLAMSRPNDKIYDYLILTRDNTYCGVVSVQDLLSGITQKQLELARAANPLTNLPGNPVIQSEITERLQSDGQFAVIYCDLDDFKAYNDYYGFERGDQVLAMTARVLQQAIKRVCPGEAFLGHIGGDDFVIVTTPDRVQPLCRDTIEMFDAEIPGLYRKEDRTNGFIEVCDRRGISQRFPLVSISLAVVTNERRSFRSCLEVSETAAELKKYVKSIPGSTFACDLRSNSANKDLQEITFSL